MRLPREIETAIAEFRGLPMPECDVRTLTAVPLDSLLEVLIERYDIGKVRPEQTIMENWVKILGEKLAHRCAPERIDAQDRLVINVPNPILRREMLFDRERIRQRVCALPGCGHIKAVEFKQG